MKDLRAPRDFRVKFPDDIMSDNLAGQLWFGAEVKCVIFSFLSIDTPGKYTKMYIMPTNLKS